MRGRNSIVVVVALVGVAWSVPWTAQANGPSTSLAPGQPVFPGSASAGVWWDNGIVPNGFSGRAMSPPNFPDIRVADDLTLPGGGVTIRELHANVIEDTGWTDDGKLTLEVRADTGSGPGGIVATHTGAFTKMATGDEYFGRADYDYGLDGIDICIGGATFWLTIRNPGGGGEGTNYWMTSDGGGDGPGTDTGWFSLDAGESWSPEGNGWHHAFVLPHVGHPDCHDNEDCDDGDPCTIDSCVGDCCVNAELPGTCCGDNYCLEMTAEQCDLAPGCIRDPQWICDGDTDGDGQVNPVDSGLVQAAFGSTDADDLCSYDIDCDGQINPVDSGIVQSLFGVCEDPRDVCTTGGVFLGCEVTCEDDPCGG